MTDGPAYEPPGLYNKPERGSEVDQCTKHQADVPPMHKQSKTFRLERCKQHNCPRLHRLPRLAASRTAMLGQHHVDGYDLAPQTARQAPTFMLHVRSRRRLRTGCTRNQWHFNTAAGLTRVLIVARQGRKTIANENRGSVAGGI